MFNLDPKKMQGMMKKLGMQQSEIPAKRVIIEKIDGKNIVIDNPSVSQITMQGQDTFQISGDIKEEENEEALIAEDIKQVMDKAMVSKEEAALALEKSNGDLAEAILSLS